MGTRKSRHNKGRKPLYKEHRQNLVDEVEGDPKRNHQAEAAAKAAMNVARRNASSDERWSWWQSYKRSKTGNVMKPGLNSLTELIVRPGIEKKLWPLLMYRGAMNPGHAHRLWNFSLLMMAAEAETLSDAILLANNPAFSQLCGPVNKPSRVTLKTFFGRMWDTPFVTDNIPGFSKYVRDMNLGPCPLIPVDVESPYPNVAPWRKSTHVDPHRYPGERSLPTTFYPYAVHDHEHPDEGAELVALINKAVPSYLPPDIRADVCQDIIVGVLSGDLERANVVDHVQKYISDHFRGRDWKFVPGGGKIGHIDAPLSLDEPGGATLHDVLHDGSYRHWSHEMDEEEDEGVTRDVVRKVLSKEQQENEMRERRAGYRATTYRNEGATQLDRLIKQEEKDAESKEKAGVV